MSLLDTQIGVIRCQQALRGAHRTQMTENADKKPNWHRERDANGHFRGKPKPKPRAFPMQESCFAQQLAFINDPAPFLTASCSRRAGKSSACARDLLYTAENNPGTVSGYITLTSRMAKRILWRELRALVKKYYGKDWAKYVKFNEVELSVKLLEQDSIIYLAGCANESEMDKFLGVALKLLYLDEVQSFRSHIGELIDRVIAPSLMDYDGKLKLIGTPALLKSGYFWDAINSDSYSHHSWTYWDNPFIPITSGKTHQALLDRELKRRGVSIDDPSIRREWFGEWANDEDARVFQYSTEHNNYQAVDCTDFVIGVDIGFNDADAIAVIGWKKHERVAYLVEEVIQAQQGVTELADQLTRLVERYKPNRVVMDTGGLGKKIAEELRKRFTLPIVAAEKTRKQEYIELLNDAMRTKRFMARASSKFAADTFVVEWDHDRSTPDRRVIKEDPHSDICDAVLYAFRESLHWLEADKRETVVLKTRADWVRHTEKLMADRLQQDIDKQDEQKAEELAMRLMFEEDGDILRDALNQKRSRR